MNGLTDRQAYAAMLHFLDVMHHRFGWEKLGDLLGSMLLIDGVPVDLAFVKDWKESVEFAVKNHEASSFKLTDEQAYSAMFHFLEGIYKNKKDHLGHLIEGMLLVDGLPEDKNLVESWRSAVEFAARGGQASPLVIEKDGISYEVHRGTGKLSE